MFLLIKKTYSKTFEFKNIKALILLVNRNKVENKRFFNLFKEWRLKLYVFKNLSMK